MFAIHLCPWRKLVLLYFNSGFRPSLGLLKTCSENKEILNKLITFNDNVFYNKKDEQRTTTTKTDDLTAVDDDVAKYM